jgi:hypothetical protein
MLAQVAAWFELKIWQLAVQAMSSARPLSARALRAAHSIKAAAQAPAQTASLTLQHSIEAHPLVRATRNGYVIAGGGWLLGLVLGYLIATR